MDCDFVKSLPQSGDFMQWRCPSVCLSVCSSVANFYWWQHRLITSIIQATM